MIDKYEEFCAQQPELAARIQGIVERGRALLENGQPQQAKKEFRRALALHPYVPAALNNLALLAFNEGDQEGARAYLEQLLTYDPHEPTACALLARYWLDMGSTPHACRWIETAVESALSLAAQSPGADTTRLRRGLEFICQVLVRLGEDGLLLKLYTELGEPELLPRTLLHVGIAYYNRGRFHQAVQLWRESLEATPDEIAAHILLDMAQIIHDHQLIPFRLDHRVDMPTPAGGRQLFLVNVPTVVLATALAHIYRGSASEAEEALPLLVGVGLPGIHKILLDVAHDVTRPVRLRLIAGVQLAVGGDVEAAVNLVKAVGTNIESPQEEALRRLIQALAAEAEGERDSARQAAVRGYQLLGGEDAEPDDQPYAQILKELAARNAAEANGKVNVEQMPDTVLDDAHVQEAAATVEWPDEEWLRIALQRSLPETLEESLANRPLDALVEAAEWLGEQNADDMEHTALIRRTAMRMRSLPLDRVIGPLSTEALSTLAWLVEQGSPITLPALQDWLAAQSPSSDLWAVLEELYWAALVDIGHARGAKMPLQAFDVLIQPIPGLAARWMQDG